MPTIPVFLLKTRSQPDDGYEEALSNLSIPTNPASTKDTQSRNGSSTNAKHEGATASRPASTAGAFTFTPQFVPVLEHQRNEASCARLEDLLRTDQLAEQYGGMIFTSQRAVEAFGDAVRKADGEVAARRQAQSGSAVPQASTMDESSSHPQTTTPSNQRISPSSTTPFPLYAVGPATARSLTSILHPTPPPPDNPTSTTSSTFPTLRYLYPLILGAQTGSGAALAPFILNHYNHIHSTLLFEYYEAPRLPFIPLVGPSSGQYARQRLDRDDVRLRKKGLLFLVGEVRRDVIPRTLMDSKLGQERVEVEEWEVYRTDVREGFEREFEGLIAGWREERGVVVVVVFSPQGCEAMLRVLGFLGEDGRVKGGLASSGERWRPDVIGAGSDVGESGDRPETRFVVATIGPTTRDYLLDTFGFEPDICAEKPSPQGIVDGITAFLGSTGFV